MIFKIRREIIFLRLYISWLTTLAFPMIGTWTEFTVKSVTREVITLTELSIYSLLWVLPGQIWLNISTFDSTDHILNFWIDGEKLNFWMDRIKVNFQKFRTQTLVQNYTDRRKNYFLKQDLITIKLGFTFPYIHIFHRYNPLGCCRQLKWCYQVDTQPQDHLECVSVYF